MRLWEDERGVSVQIGAILLFAVLVVLLSTYQAYVVPQENEAIEFQHSQAVESDLQDVRNAILAAAGSGAGQPEAVQLGVRYPVRVFFMNPSPMTGTLRTETVGSGDITIANVTAVDDETADFFNSSTFSDGTISYDTKALVYEGDYNVYENAPTRVFEDGLLYNDYDNETVASTQVLVSGRTVTFVTLNGTYSKNGVDATSIDPETLSGPYNPIQVTNETAGNVTITLNTRLSAERWESRTSLGNQDHVLAVEQAGENQVRVVLEGGVDYTFRAARIGVGTETTTPDAAYVTRVGSGPVSTGEQVAFEVRDEYNNPVSGAEVRVNEDSLVNGDGNQTTADSGRATYTYVGSGENFTAYISPNSGAKDRVTIDGRASSGGNGTGGAFDVEWENASGSEIDCTPSSNNPSWCELNTTSGTSVDLVASVTSSSGPLTGASVDFARNSSFGSLSDEIASTEDGNASTTLTVPDQNGSVEVFAASGGNTDDITIRVVSPPEADQTPQIDFRLDDLSHPNENSVEYVGSYGISNTNSSFERVEIEYANTDASGAGQTLQKSGTRGGLTYTSSYGATDTYEVTVRVIYSDGQGGEYVAASETVSDVADAVNPSGNDDIGTASTAVLEGSVISDTSQNGPSYQFDYSVSSGGYSETRLAVVSVDSDGGGKDTVTRTQRTGDDVSLSTYGMDVEYKLAILVFGPDGAVVDTRIVNDTADGSGP